MNDIETVISLLLAETEENTRLEGLNRKEIDFASDEMEYLKQKEEDL